MEGLRYKMHVYTYDTNHGYRKQMVRENAPCLSFLCQFSILQRPVFIIMISGTQTPIHKLMIDTGQIQQTLGPRDVNSSGRGFKTFFHAQLS